jgi:hypothetical protein
MEIFAATFWTSPIGFVDEISHRDNFRYFVMPTITPDLLTFMFETRGNGFAREEILEDAGEKVCLKLDT